MSRYRSIRDTMSIIKEEDPETALTEYCLRQMVLGGYIPSLKTGNKHLVDIDTVFRVLNGNTAN